MPPTIPVTIPAFKKQKIEVTPPGFFKGVQLLANGQPATRGAHRGEYLLIDDQGQTLKARFRHQAFGLDYPQLEVGKQTINIVDPLKWYWWVLAALPFLLVTFGAGLGGLIGIIAVWVNVRLLRQPWHWLARLGAVLGVALLALGLWLFLYLAISGEL
jgi:hypothetical protein